MCVCVCVCVCVLCRYYEPVVKKNADNLLGVTAIVLANLCVSYIMTSQVRACWSSLRDTAGFGVRVCACVCVTAHVFEGTRKEGGDTQGCVCDAACMCIRSLGGAAICGKPYLG